MEGNSVEMDPAVVAHLMGQAGGTSTYIDAWTRNQKQDEKDMKMVE